MVSERRVGTVGHEAGSRKQRWVTDQRHDDGESSTNTVVVIGMTLAYGS